MKIYIIDFWVPFPSSEYGGLIVAIANNDEEVLELLSKHSQINGDYHPDYNTKENIQEAIINAKTYDILGNYEPSIVETFLT